METKTLHEQLVKIQQTLKAPKGQYNSYSKFNYRSCEDILEAVKPLLNGLALMIVDEVVNVGNSNYVKATVVLSNGIDKIFVTAYAREAEVQTGMQAAQITGSTSSYARKYALNGLFAIDDTKDADTQDNTKTEMAKADTDADWIKAKTEDEAIRVEEKLEGTTLARQCLIHNVSLLRALSKTKVDKQGNPKPYWYHPVEQGGLCFGNE